MARGRLPLIGELFGRGWSRVRGRGPAGPGGAVRPSGPLVARGSYIPPSRRGQMGRAARGASPAIFKCIPRGGCRTGGQLRAQLTYLCTKSALILDARGTYDGRAVLSAAEVRDVAERFEELWDRSRPLRLGHTTHLMMAFPVGTTREQVVGVARGLCERFFEGEGAQFDYLVAVHEDRAHPHAHVVLNRHAWEGEVFRLGREERFNYQAFREAMVELGDAHGLHLEATQRLDRGVVTERASVRELRAAMAEGRAVAAVAERERAGPSLGRARAHVAEAREVYQELAAEAEGAGSAELHAALARAAELLARGEAVTHWRDAVREGAEAVHGAASHGPVYEAGALGQDDGEAQETELGAAGGAREAPPEAEDRGRNPERGEREAREAYARLVREFEGNVRAVQARIATARPEARPGLEQGLFAALVEVAHVAGLPERLGVDAAALREPPSEVGLYSRVWLASAGLEGGALGRLDDPRVAAALGTALRGTGIDRDELVARLKVGADSAALEQHWNGRDAAALAVRTGLDLGREADMERVLDRLDAMQNRVEAALRREGVLRAAPVAGPVVELAREARTKDTARKAPARQVPDPEQARARERERELAAERARLAEAARAQAAREQAQREAQEAQRARAAEAEVIATVLERGSWRFAGDPAFANRAQAQAFRAAVEARLGPGELARLAQGDEATAAGLVGEQGGPEADRRGRLVLAKAYMESVGVPEGSAAHERVVYALIDAQIDAKREREGPEHGDDWGH